MAFLNSKNTGYLVKKPMTWGFLAQIWTKKLTKNKYVTSPTPQNPIHTIPPSLHPFSFLSLFSPSHTFSPLLPHVFLFTPPPLKTPIPYPQSPQISLPTLILHTQISPFPPLKSPYPKLSPGLALNPSLIHPQTTPKL